MGDLLRGEGDDAAVFEPLRFFGVDGNLVIFISSSFTRSTPALIFGCVAILVERRDIVKSFWKERWNWNGRTRR